MNLIRLPIILFAAVAVMTVDVSVKRGEGPAGKAALTIELNQAGAFVRKIGRAFRRLGRKIKKGFKKVGKAFKKAGKKIKKGFKKAGKALKKVGKKIKKGFVKAGKAIKKGLVKAGKAIKKGFQKVGQWFKKLGKKIKGWFKGIKKKIVNGFKKFVQKIVNWAKKIFNKVLNKILGKVAGKMRLGLEQVERVVDMNTGKIKMKELSNIAVKMIEGWVKPWLEDKIGDILNKAFSYIRPYLDIAVKAIVGAIGSIPFAGGVLAALVSAGYSWGIQKLLDWAAQKLAGLTWKWASTLLKKGLNFLIKKVAPLRQFMERVTRNALKLYSYIKKGRAAVNKLTK